MLYRNQLRVLHIAHLCRAMCKTDDRTVRPFVGLETMQEIYVLVSHRFNCFAKVVLNMIIKLKFKFINYSNINIIKIHITNTNNKNGKHMTILVIQLNEPWQRVSAVVLGQDRLGGKRHSFKEGMTKGKFEFNVHAALTF